MSRRTSGSSHGIGGKTRRDGARRTGGSRPAELNCAELVGAASGIDTTQDGSEALLGGRVGQNGCDTCRKLVENLTLLQFWGLVIHLRVHSQVAETIQETETTYFAAVPRKAIHTAFATRWNGVVYGGGSVQLLLDMFARQGLYRRLELTCGVPRSLPPSFQTCSSESYWLPNNPDNILSAWFVNHPSPLQFLRKVIPHVNKFIPGF